METLKEAGADSILLMNKKKERRRNVKSNFFFLLTLLPFFIIIIGFLILPLLAMIYSSLQADGGTHFSLIQFKTIFTNSFYLIAIRNSIVLSLYSSIWGIVVGLVVAYSITRLSPKVRDICLMLSNMTSNFAGVPLAFAYILLMGYNGLFTVLFAQLGIDIFSDFDLYTLNGITLVYIYFQIPLAILLIYPTYYGIEKQWQEAASLLGASTFKFWLRIGIPYLLPGIVGTFSILFANAMGAYATAYALVGGNYNLLAIRIGSLVSGDVFAKPQLGSALAVFLTITMLLSMIINESMMRRVRRDMK